MRLCFFKEKIMVGIESLWDSRDFRTYTPFTSCYKRKFMCINVNSYLLSCTVSYLYTSTRLIT